MNTLKIDLKLLFVENGSTDRTNALVSEFKQNTTLPLKTIKLDRNGVSYAKNVGASLASNESKWLIFLDADTHLKKDFLKELEETITKNDYIVIIVTSLRPLDNSFKAKAWFSFYNFGRWVSESSMSIQIVRKDIFERIKFDETLTFNEDLTLIKQSKKFGKFYYMWINNVFTSTRRFDKVGYLKQFLIWVWWNIIPSSKRRKISYPVVR